MSVGLEFLGIVILTYIDDSTILAVKEDLKESLEAFDTLCGGLGLILSDKPESNMQSLEGDTVTALGMDFKTDWEKEIITVELPPEKIVETRAAL